MAPTCTKVETCADCGNAPHQCICDMIDGGEVCGLCDGTGVADGYEQDPNWYHPGGTCPCPACGGTGR